MTMFQGNEKQLPKLFRDLVSLARSNNWETHLYEGKPPNSSNDYIEMSCSLEDFRLGCEYTRDEDTHRWSLRIAYIAIRPHRMPVDRWKREHGGGGGLFVHLTRTGVVWCIKNPNEIERDFSAELDPVQQDLGDEELLNYSLSIIEWMAETGRAPDSGADDENERLLGGMLSSIRGQVLQRSEAA